MGPIPGVPLHSPEGSFRSTPGYILSPLPGLASIRFDDLPTTSGLVAEGHDLVAGARRDGGLTTPDVSVRFRLDVQGRRL